MAKKNKIEILNIMKSFERKNEEMEIFLVSVFDFIFLMERSKDEKEKLELLERLKLEAFEACFNVWKEKWSNSVDW